MLLIMNQLFHVIGIKTTTYPLTELHCISSNLIVFHDVGWATGEHECIWTNRVGK